MPRAYNRSVKKLSPRALTALCNLALAFIVLVIGAVCFLPSSAAVSAPAGKVYDRGTKPAVSLTINVYWGTDIVEKMLDLFREKGVRVTSPRVRQALFAREYGRDRNERRVFVARDGEANFPLCAAFGGVFGRYSARRRKSGPQNRSLEPRYHRLAR